MMKPHEVYPLPGNTPEGVDLPRHLPQKELELGSFNARNIYIYYILYVFIVFYSILLFCVYSINIHHMNMMNIVNIYIYVYEHAISIECVYSLCSVTFVSYFLEDKSPTISQ